MKYTEEREKILAIFSFSITLKIVVRRTLDKVYIPGTHRLGQALVQSEPLSSHCGCS